MMQRRSTGGELSAFEGLVHATARMFSVQVKREEDDLAQELRIVVWRAVSKYDPSRSSLSLERFVFGALTNKIRDYKRDAAREYARRQRYELTFLHIEDFQTGHGEHDTSAERFDGQYHFVTRDEVFGHIENGKFVLPSTVTQREAEVLVLMLMELTKPEIRLRLKMTRPELEAALISLRHKFADWAPQRPSDSRVVDVDVAVAA